MNGYTEHFDSGVKCAKHLEMGTLSTAIQRLRKEDTKHRTSEMST
jgi:hypothetical protein